MRTAAPQPQRRPPSIVVLTLGLAAVVTFTGCRGSGGNGDASDAPGATTGPETGFTSGTAHVEVSGDLDTTLDLTLATDSVSSFEEGNVSLAWEDSEGNFMSISATPKAGEADARSDETPLVATFVVGGKSFNSQATRTCSVSFDELTAQSASGTLTCEKLRLPGGATFRAVDVEATFSASAG